MQPVIPPRTCSKSSANVIETETRGHRRCRRSDSWRANDARLSRRKPASQNEKPATVVAQPLSRPQRQPLLTAHPSGPGERRACRIAPGHRTDGAEHLGQFHGVIARLGASADGRLCARYLVPEKPPLVLRVCSRDDMGRAIDHAGTQQLGEDSTDHATGTPLRPEILLHHVSHIGCAKTSYGGIAAASGNRSVASSSSLRDAGKNGQVRAKRADRWCSHAEAPRGVYCPKRSKAMWASAVWACVTQLPQPMHNPARIMSCGLSNCRGWRLAMASP